MRHVVVLATVLCWSCGGAPASDVHDPADGDGRSRPAGGGDSGFASQSRVGGMDKVAVQAAVGEVMGTVDACVTAGRKRLPYLGGDVSIFVQVNKSGRATVAYLERSTLGDHQVEGCIIEAFRSRQWPRPVGGEVGEISQGFDFSAGHLEPPDDWSEDKLRAADGATYDELLANLARCRDEAGTAKLDVTMYLDEDGLVQGVGMGTGDEKGLAALSCVTTTVQTTSFSPPRVNLVKVTVGVR